MEEIIVFLIVLCLSALFDYFRSSIKKKADSSCANGNVLPNNYQRLANLMSQFEESDKANKVDDEDETEFKSTFTSHRFHFNFNHESEEIVEPTMVETKPTSDKPTNSPIKANQPQPKPIATPTVVDTADTDREAAEHYERWRQAIIYAEIITPKFKSE